MKVFLSIKNQDVPDSVFPMEYQLKALDKKYGETKYTMVQNSTCVLRVYETDQPCFSVGSKQFYLFLDENADVSITRNFYESICSQGCWDFVNQMLVLLRDGMKKGRIGLSLEERDKVLFHLAAINEKSQGSGLTLRQVYEILKQPFKGYMTQMFFDDLEAYVYNKRLYKHAIEQLAIFRIGGNFKNGKGMEFLYPKREITSPIRFLFISYGSLWHQDIWNNLSVETLIGDLYGEFGNEVECSHIRICDVSEIQEALELIQRINPDIIGFSIEIRALQMHETFEGAYRKKTGAAKLPLIIYGNTVPTYASSYFADNYVTEPGQSMIILGYGEEGIRQVILYKKNQSDISAIPNAVWRDDSGIIRYNPRRYDANIVIHPPVQFEINTGVSNTLEASRGCRFNCTFCSQGPQSKWDPVPIDRVIKNIEILLSRGVHELEFVDNEFFGGRSDKWIVRAYQITDAIKKLSEKYNVKISFRIFTNPLIIAREGANNLEMNHKMSELLQYMKSCGLTRLYIGIESASENQRKRYNRRDTIQDIILAIKVVRDLGIALDAGFIMFDPLMDLNDIKENVNFYKSYNLIETNTWPHRELCVLFDTPMLNILKEKGLITGVDYYELVYTYKYASKEMADFTDTVLEFGAKTGKLFQVLKYSTKELFSDELKHEALLFSRKMVDENARVFLELMEEMIKCLEKGSGDYGKCLEKAQLSMKELITDIEKNLVIYDKNSAHYPKLVKNLYEAKKQLGMASIEQI